MASMRYAHGMSTFGAIRERIRRGPTILSSEVRAGLAYFWRGTRRGYFSRFNLIRFYKLKRIISRLEGIITEVLKEFEG